MRSVRNRLRTMRQPSILPSLYDRYPHASSATRRMRGLQIVPVERIVGTTRHPSQVTDDFLPLPELRGRPMRILAVSDEPDPSLDSEAEAGLAILGFSGSPVYNDPKDHMQVSSTGMWLRWLRGWLAAFGRGRPMLVISHAPPRGMNDASDLTHRGFTAFGWLLDRLRPPLWLHGHTALVRRGLDGRSLRRDDALLYNCTGATLVELVPPSH